ncbi:hypothetical protein [Burkholderia sp. SRS-W-2-2016]|uniref:hypothetical protein n=1 Tax=Burkholderia sp. SRS-W-2-2016 TaxID=1926878 RepID=UPI000B134F41|nr:hypothetical protein [Burkholderia sp. SRS-W-2-2016]
MTLAGGACIAWLRNTLFRQCKRMLNKSAKNGYSSDYARLAARLKRIAALVALTPQTKNAADGTVAIRGIGS